MLTQYFVLPVFTFAFIFHCRSFSPCSPLAALNFHVFLPTKFVSFVFKTRSSSFSIIHVSGNIKNNAEKETTLLLFFLSKSPGGHVISFQIKPRVVCGLPYLMIELFYVGMPVVRTDGRSLARLVYGHVIINISLAMGLRPPAARRVARGAPLKIQ